MISSMYPEWFVPILTDKSKIIQEAQSTTLRPPCLINEIQNNKIANSLEITKAKMDLLDDANEANEKGRYKEAIAIYVRVLGEENDDRINSFAAIGFATSMAEQHRIDCAEQSYMYAEKFRLNTILIDLGRAQLAILQDDASKAIELYENVLDVAPRDKRAQVGLGDAYLLDGNINEARILYNAVLSQDPQYENAMVGTGNIAFKTGQYDKALKLYNEVLEKNNFKINALRGKVITYLQQDDLNNAALFYQRIVNINPDFKPDKELATMKNFTSIDLT